MPKKGEKSKVKGRKIATAPMTWTQAQNLIKLLKADKNYFDAMLFASGIYFGLRIGDILQLKWKDVKSERFEIKEGKTKKHRKIKVNADYIKLVKEILKDVDGISNEYVFLPTRERDRKGVPISVVSANKRIKAVFEKYEVKVQNPSSHTLRKTFGRRIYENNNRSEAALILLSDIFNHQSLSTTRRYIGLTEEKISNAYDNLS